MVLLEWLKPWLGGWYLNKGGCYNTRRGYIGVSTIILGAPHYSSSSSSTSPPCNHPDHHGISPPPLLLLHPAIQSFQTPDLSIALDKRCHVVVIACPVVVVIVITSLFSTTLSIILLTSSSPLHPPPFYSASCYGLLLGLPPLLFQWHVGVGACAVPIHHYIGKMGYHTYGWSACQQCRTLIGYAKLVKHQTGILQITTIRSRNQGDIDGTSRIVLPCPSS